MRYMMNLNVEKKSIDHRGNISSFAVILLFLARCGDDSVVKIQLSLCRDDSAIKKDKRSKPSGLDHHE
jgi:hypothetical protein